MGNPITGIEIAAKIIDDAEAIERTKQGRALTADEVRTVRAANFLKQIMEPSCAAVVAAVRQTLPYKPVT